MTLDERSSEVLSYIINSESYVSIEELTEKISISKRTLYYDVEKINSWLKNNQLNPINYIRETGFYLDDGTKESLPNLLSHLKKWEYEYSAKERRAWLAIHIITRMEKVFLKNLMQIIRVSRNTAISDLKIVKEEMQNFNVTILTEKKRGYVIEGREQDKRKALIFYLSHVISNGGVEHFISQIVMFFSSDEIKRNAENTDFFKKDTLSQIDKILADCENELGVEFTDEVLHDLSLHVVLFIRRFIQGKEVLIDPIEKDVLKVTKEYAAARQISTKLEEVFQIIFPEDEVFYLTTHILSAKVNYFKNNPENEAEVMLRESIFNMVNDFQRYACVNFQQREALEINLMIHLKPAYYRAKYGLYLDNPLTESIKKKYKEIFILTKKIIHHFEKNIGKEVSDDEVAFIAMHFGGWMKREGVVPATRKKVLIVCGNGVGTSRILQNQLEGLFSTIDIIKTVSLREYETNDYQVDLVISTIPIKKKAKNVFLVSPILTDRDKENLFKKVNSYISPNRQVHSMEAIIEIISKYAVIHDKENLYQELKQYMYKPIMKLQEDIRPMLDELLTEDKIQLKDKVDTWEEAITLTATPLLCGGYITEAYIQAMIDNVKEFGPYIVIAPQVAIPHARSEQGVKKVGMSFMRIKEGVCFSDKEEHKANLIIVLAATDNETHLKALAQLSTMLSEEDNIQKLVAAQSVGGILTLIQKYSMQEG